MNCKFCDKECELVSAKSWECADCNALFCKPEDGNSEWVNIFCNLKNDLYCLQIRYHTEDAVVIRGIPGSSTSKFITKFDYIPNITPQNIQQKLPTIITFS